eukprot:TRINITY_DN10115_c0_g1_i2.p1 TRINITY_DN10115_c0_g1~~TRINITY_DN10115_c0_g1_i2.p1  ORF type:complete len:512 (+),score=91.06 TRINITY_DN10115_c0_g1_i2:55-1536(+)
MAANRESARSQKSVAWGDGANGEADEERPQSATISREDSRMSKRLSQIDIRDQEALRSKIMKSLKRVEKYDVRNFYSQKGLFQFLARHPRFESSTLAVISLNALWMWIDADFNGTDEFFYASPIFQLAEHFFCIFFSVELYIRFRAFESKRNCLRDAWFVFDSILVILMVLETWLFNMLVVITGSRDASPLGGNTAIIRLFRLLRLSRLIRMLRSMPELMILVKGMITAMKSVGYVMVLLLIMIYVFAIALTQSARDFGFGEVFFTTVPYSMYSLIIYGTFLDNLASFLNEMIYEEAWICLTLAFAFIGLACLTVLNMLIGVLCEVVAEVADTERENIQSELMTEQMTRIIGEIDTDFNGRISLTEFKEVLAYPDALRALEAIDVDPLLLIDFADMFFTGESEGENKDLSFDEFMEIVLDLRGNNAATVKDSMNVWKQLNPKMLSQIKDIESMSKTAKALDYELKTGSARIEEKIAVMVEQLQQLAKINPKAG